MASTKRVSLFPILLVNFIGTLGFSIVLPNRIEEEGRVIVSRGEFQLRMGLTLTVFVASFRLLSLTKQKVKT